MLDDRGEITHRLPTMVAGVPIDLGEHPFHLLSCRQCGFQFKHPSINEAHLKNCYAQAADSHWGEDPDPYERRLDLLRDTLEKHARGRRILDVGCFNGAILNVLGPGWDRYGVEPSISAARRATERGIRVLGSDLNAVVGQDGSFDVVMLIDVVEHIADPLPVLRRASSLLNPEGILVISTGDTNAWSWRVLGSRYWYCSLPEHVSFFSLPALDRLAESLGLTIISTTRMSHVRAGKIRRLRKAVKNLAYAAARRANGLWIPALQRYLNERPAPDWLTARDHVLVVMRAASNQP